VIAADAFGFYSSAYHTTVYSTLFSSHASDFPRSACACQQRLCLLRFQIIAASTTMALHNLVKQCNTMETCCDMTLIAAIVPSRVFNSNDVLQEA
jgi:hypothetical protein